MKKNVLSFIVLIGMSGGLYAQNINWKKAKTKDKEALVRLELRKDLGNNPLLFTIDYSKIKTAFANLSAKRSTSTRIALPDSEGNIIQFDLTEVQTMEPELAAKYPNIKTYKGKSINSDVDAYVSITPHGINGLLRDSYGTETFIDTYSLKDNAYVVYKRGDQINAEDFKCLVTTNENAVSKNQQGLDQTTLSNDKTFRTFRLAMACTIEYASFHIDRAGVGSGTIADKKEAVLAAMVTTMHRVNSIYERDMALHMNLVANNDELIFIDSDEFSNDNANTLINQSQRVIDKVIGSANYDIGHTVSTGGGGLAGLGVPCTSSKARGITGSPRPIGDPYDIDYVAHEMGHQFGANHTFNNSSGGNRNFATAFEPGSGSTIMAYAGISNPNVQENSDSYFHAISILEMQNVLKYSATCSTNQTSLNSVPIVNAGKNYVIPVGTPFILRGKATGADQESYTYSWEQMNNEISVQPPIESSKSGPNFRSIMPSTSPDRYMPSYSDVINYVDDPSKRLSNTWEVVPTVPRTMGFNLTVRNFANPLGGQVGMGEMSVQFVGNSAFAITDLGTKDEDNNVQWKERTEEVITWDVPLANETDIKTTHVNILYSLDNGETFETLLANAPNNGSAKIKVPTGITTEARIMIEPVDNIYYALSQKFTVIEGNKLIENIIDSDEFIVYPNPSRGEFRAQVTANPNTPVKITMHDMSGKQVFSKVYPAEENFDQTVDVTFLQSGVYIIKVNNGVETKDKKIVIQ